jgi:hypothetical protein
MRTYQDTKPPKYVKTFRGQTIAGNSKRELMELAFDISREDGVPVSTLEFVYDLHATRFGGIIFDLRKVGWVIDTQTHTLDSGEEVFKYKLVAKPEEELKFF